MKTYLFYLAMTVAAIVSMRLAASPALAAGPGDVEVADGELLERYERRNRAFEEFLRAEVARELNEARRMMAARPDEAENTLQVLRDKVRRATELDPSLRSQMIAQIDAGLRMARRQAAIVEHRPSRQEVPPPRSAERAADRSLAHEQERADSLVQFNALMAEHRYRDAEMLASVAQESNASHPELQSAALLARMSGNASTVRTIRAMQGAGVLDTWRAETVASIPAPDSPPILYPDPAAWQLLRNRGQSQRRAVDVKHYTQSELKVLDALDEETTFDFIDEPLSLVLDYFKQRHGIEIQLDRRNLIAAGIDPATPITRAARGITLRSALKLLLGDLDLAYSLRYEVLFITTATEAATMRDIRVYPVADLVSSNPFIRRAARLRGITRMSRAAAAGNGAF